jgi:hypothetical protein
MNQVEIYRAKSNQIEIEVRFENESVWLSQYQLAELFETDRSSILKHLKNIFRTDELNEKQTCAKFAQVRKEETKTIIVLK